MQLDLKKAKPCEYGNYEERATTNSDVALVGEKKKDNVC